jgi:hypothetical protein
LQLVLSFDKHEKVTNQNELEVGHKGEPMRRRIVHTADYKTAVQAVVQVVVQDFVHMVDSGIASIGPADVVLVEVVVEAADYTDSADRKVERALDCRTVNHMADPDATGAAGVVYCIPDLLVNMESWDTEAVDQREDTDMEAFQPC